MYEVELYLSDPGYLEATIVINANVDELRAAKRDIEKLEWRGDCPSLRDLLTAITDGIKAAEAHFRARSKEPEPGE